MRRSQVAAGREVAVAAAHVSSEVRDGPSCGVTMLSCIAAAEVSRRLRMVVALRDIPPRFRFNIFAVLMRPKANDPSRRVRAAAAETLTILRKRSHEWFGRRAQREAALIEDRAVAGGTTAG